jgi:tetratricopeptide (TPR) repeat protein
MDASGTSGDGIAAIRRLLAEGAAAAALDNALVDLPRRDDSALRRLALELATTESTREQGVSLVTALTRAFETDAKNWETRALIGRYYTKNYKDVLSAATRALNGGLKSVDLFTARAIALMERGEARRALTDYDAALALPPDANRKLLEALRDECTHATDAIETVRQHVDELEAGKLSVRDLIRKWSRHPVTPSELADAAARKPGLAIAMGWTLRV